LNFASYQDRTSCGGCGGMTYFLSPAFLGKNAFISMKETKKKEKVDQEKFNQLKVLPVKENK